MRRIRGAHFYAREMLSPWVISITSAVVIVGLTIIIDHHSISTISTSHTRITRHTYSRSVRRTTWENVYFFHSKLVLVLHQPRPKNQKATHQNHKPETMSGFLEHGRTASGSPMASRGRGRKQAKKGVQLTLMVVGESARASSFGVCARHSIPRTIYSNDLVLTRPLPT